MICFLIDLKLIFSDGNKIGKIGGFTR